MKLSNSSIENLLHLPVIVCYKVLLVFKLSQETRILHYVAVSNSFCVQPLIYIIYTYEFIYIILLYYIYIYLYRGEASHFDEKSFNRLEISQFDSKSEVLRL